MKVLWKLTREAARYKGLYVAAILSTLFLTCVNLIAPMILSRMTGVVQQGMDALSFIVVSHLALMLLGVYLARVVFRFFSNYLAHKAAWCLVGDLRSRLYDKLQQMHLSFFRDKQTGDLMSRVVNDTREFELLYAHIIPELLTNIVTFVGVLLILLTINMPLALITCAPIPLILFSGVIFAKKVRPYFHASQKCMGDLNAKLQDNLSGLREIQSFGRQDDARNQVNEKNFAQVRAMLRALRASAIFHPCVEFLASAGTVLVVFFGGLLAFHGQLSAEQIVAFVLYLSLFYTPISNFATLLENLQQALAGSQRVAMILNAPIQIQDAEDAFDLGKAQGAIEFEHVSFCYEKASPVLSDISFSCKPGMMVALVGPTGVGKTTITQLLSRFYTPDAGRILIDGHDIGRVAIQSLRRNIAPVLQDTFLFNDTIANNIAYARPDATLQQVQQAAKAAFIHDDIMQMPQGYDTLVGERGLRLSGGQKQRIAIARAIVRQAPIIILDEATASVDVQTEQQIQNAIRSMTGTHTIVAIAHRLSTIRHADLILLLKNGKIAERGTHEELMAKRGEYYRMQQTQVYTC